MIYEKPDGAIEIEGSGCCCPPGQRRKGMHTNACTTWVRVGGKVWMPVRNATSVRILAGAAETCDEFFKAFLGEEQPRFTYIGGVWVRLVHSLLAATPTGEELVVNPAWQDAVPG